MQLKQGKETVLVIPDLQAPFEHQDSLAFMAKVRDTYKPTRVVCIGDSLDMHRLAKWTADPDSPGPADEHAQGLAFLQKLFAVFPKATEVWSNHNARYLKRLSESGIPSAFIKDYRDIVKYPKGWSIEEDVEIDGIIYEHGTRFGGASAARQAIQSNWKSTVFGHHHSHGGITYQASPKEMLFAMNVGCLIDIQAVAFKYAKDARLKPTLGMGVVTRGVPTFIPMITDSKSRWVGKLV